MSDLELKERLANIDKLQQETLKLHADFELTRKKVNWFEFTMGALFFGVVISLVKLFF